MNHLLEVIHDIRIDRLAYPFSARWLDLDSSSWIVIVKFAFGKTNK